MVKAMKAVSTEKGITMINNLTDIADCARQLELDREGLCTVLRNEPADPSADFFFLEVLESDGDWTRAIVRHTSKALVLSSAALYFAGRQCRISRVVRSFHGSFSGTIGGTFEFVPADGYSGLTGLA